MFPSLLTNLCEYPLDVVKIDRDVLLKTEHEKGKRLFFWNYLLGALSGS